MRKELCLQHGALHRRGTERQGSLLCKVKSVVWCEAGCTYMQKETLHSLAMCVPVPTMLGSRLASGVQDVLFGSRNAQRLLVSVPEHT